MLRPKIKIQIGTDPGWEFTYCQEVQIFASRDNFTRTATIVLPQRFYARNRKIIDEIAIGDPVSIEIGYYPNLERRFQGYITKRVPDSPLQLMCEDEGWQYKNRFLDPVTLEDATLGSFINALYSGEIGLIANPTEKIGDWRVPKFTTFLKALDSLRSTFGISAFWDDDKALFVNAQLATLSTVESRIFDFNKNLISTEGMDYQEAKEYSQIVYYSSIQEGLQEDGTPEPKLEVYAFYDSLGKIQSSPTKPELQGNVNTFSIPYFTYEEIESLAKTRLEKLNFTGYRGNFLTFGEPIAKVNDDCQIINGRSPEMEGRYRIKAVNVSYGISGGYRQDIEVARKITATEEVE